MWTACWLVVLLALPHARAVIYRPFTKLPMKNTTLKWNAKTRLEGPNMCAKETMWESSPKSFDIAWSAGAACVQTSIRIECCEGWISVPGERGCTQATPLSSPDLAAGRVQASCWYRLLMAAGLKNYLDDQTEAVTLFLPVDAVAASYDTDCRRLVGYGLPSYSISGQSHNVLSYVVRGRYRSESMKNNMVLVSEASSYGQSIRINVFPNGLTTANCVPLLTRDVATDGPLIHTLSGPLPQHYLYAIPDMLARPGPREIWSGKFYAMITEQHGVKTLLDSSGPFTVFVPSDAAVNVLDVRMVHALRYDSAAMKALVLNHIVDGVQCSSMLNDALLVAHGGENSRTGCRRGRTTYVRDAKLVVADYMASNGVMHIIDRVLVPRRAMLMLELLRNLGLSTFAGIAEKAGLTAMFSSPDTFTVFAPTNAALNVLAENMNATDAGIFILNHVISGRVLSTSMKNNEQISSRGSRLPLTVRTLRDKLLIDAAVVTSSDVEGLNGVVNVLDRPLVAPSRKTIIQQLKDDGGYSQFLYALRTMLPSFYARLETGNEEFTLFAVGDSYLTNRFHLYYDSRVLYYHILGRAVVSEEVPTNGRLAAPTVSNAQLLLVRRGGHFMAGSAHILQQDILCSNGVIHVARDVIIDPRQ